MVGTRSLKLKIIKNNNLKLTNLKKIQVDNKQTSWLVEVLKIIGVGVLAAALGAVGQAWASAGLVAMGVGELGVGVGAAFVGASVEFATMTAYDAITGNLDPLNLALNALSFAKVVKVASTEVKMTKALKLAEATGLFKQIGIKAGEVKNYTDLLKVLAGKKIVLKQTIFDFSKGVNRSDVLQMFSTWSTKNAVSNISKIMKTQKGILGSNLDDLIKLQNILTDINPKLFPRIQSKYWKEARDLIAKKGLKPKDLLNDSKFSKLVLSARTSAGNVSGQLVWALYSLRFTKSLDLQLSSKLMKYIKSANKALSYLDLQKQFNKILSSAVDVVMKPIQKVVTKIKKKVIKKIDPLVKKMGISKLAKATYKNIDKILIPVISEWILGYKVQPLPTGTYTVMIYFKNPKYEPRIFYWNQKEMISWVNACNKQKPGEYYKRNLELGYHLTNSSILGALNFLPPIMIGFIKEGIRTWNEIKKIKKMINTLKSDPNSYLNGAMKNANKLLNTKKNNFIVATVFSSVFFRGALKNFLNHKSNKNYFRDHLIKKGIQKSNNKVKEIKTIR